MFGKRKVAQVEDSENFSVTLRVSHQDLYRVETTEDDVFHVLAHCMSEAAMKAEEFCIQRETDDDGIGIVFSIKFAGDLVTTVEDDDDGDDDDVEPAQVVEPEVAKKIIPIGSN